MTSEAFGVASVRWRCGVAGLGPLHAAFPKPDNCLDRLPLRCFATDRFKASVGLEISFSRSGYFSLYLFSDSQGLILLTQFKGFLLVCLCHTPAAALAQ